MQSLRIERLTEYAERLAPLGPPVNKLEWMVDDMRTELVEIYSDASNGAIMRHPGRQFPGMLIQGDSLYNLSRMASAALADAVPESEQYYELEALVEDLRGRVSYYMRVMSEHGLKLPFFP